MDDRYIELVKETVKELSDIMNVSVKDRAKDVIKSAMGRSVRTKDAMFWPAGMLLLGLVEARKKLLSMEADTLDASADPKAPGPSFDGEAANKLVSEIDSAVYRHICLWKDKYGSRIDYIDDALAGAALVKLYCQLRSKGKGEGALASACEQAAGRIYGYLADAPKDKVGSIVYNPSRSSNVFADGAGQTAMFLLLYGKTFGDENAVGLGELQLLNFMKYGCDEKSGLVYHGYGLTSDDEEDGAGIKTLKKGVLSWGRAAGWILMGLKECKAAPELNRWYEELSKTLLSYQRPEGGFAWQIQAIEGHIDTSATGMIVYALPDKEDFQGDIAGAEKALWQNINSGKVMNSLSSCDDFGVHYQSYGNYPWGQGAVLAALSK